MAVHKSILLKKMKNAPYEKKINKKRILQSRQKDRG